MEVTCNFGQDGLHTGWYSALRCLSITLVAYGGEGLQMRETEQYLTLRCLSIVLVAYGGEGCPGEYGWSRTETESQRQLASYSLNTD